MKEKKGPNLSYAEMSFIQINKSANIARRLCRWQGVKMAMKRYVRTRIATFSPKIPFSFIGIKSGAAAQLLPNRELRKIAPALSFPAFHEPSLFELNGRERERAGDDANRATRSLPRNRLDLPPVIIIFVCVVVGRWRQARKRKIQSRVTYIFKVFWRSFFFSFFCVSAEQM